MSSFWKDATTTIAKLLSEDCYKVIKSFLRPVFTGVPVCCLNAYYPNWFARFDWAPFLILFILVGIILAVLQSPRNKSRKRGAQEGRFMSVVPKLFQAIAQAKIAIMVHYPQFLAVKKRTTCVFVSILFSLLLGEYFFQKQKKTKQLLVRSFYFSKKLLSINLLSINFSFF